MPANMEVYPFALNAVLFSGQVNLDVDPEEEAYILSSMWGSFFYHPEDDPEHNRHMNTFWGELVTKYCDIAIPSVEYIAGMF